MQTWAIANQKGGTGKTTTAVNLGHALALKRQRVLIVDFDPQASASAWLGQVRQDRAFVDVLHGRGAAADLVVETGRERLTLLPSSPLLALAGDELLTKPGRDLRLRRALEPLKSSYDWLLIDCPPALGTLQIMALAAADKVLVPIETRPMAMVGFDALREVVDDIRANIAQVRIGAIVPVRVDTRTLLSREVVDALRQEHGSLVTKSEIREGVRLAEAPGFQRTIYEHAADSAGAEDYTALARELLRGV